MQSPKKIKQPLNKKWCDLHTKNQSTSPQNKIRHPCQWKRKLTTSPKKIMQPLNKKITQPFNNKKSENLKYFYLSCNFSLSKIMQPLPIFFILIMQPQSIKTYVTSLQKNKETVFKTFSYKKNGTTFLHQKSRNLHYFFNF